MNLSIRKYGTTLAAVVDFGESVLLNRLDAYAIINPRKFLPFMLYVFPFVSGSEVRDVVGYIPDKLTTSHVKRYSYMNSLEDLTLEQLKEGAPFIAPDGTVLNKMLYNQCKKIALVIEDLQNRMSLTPTASDSLILFDMMLFVMKHALSNDHDVQSFVDSCETNDVSVNFKMPLAKWDALLNKVVEVSEKLTDDPQFAESDSERLAIEVQFLVEGVKKILRPSIGV